MATLKTEYCVQIRVPLRDSGDVGFGSGYTLGPHWVLTAYHVLFPPDHDPNGPLEIQWWDESGKPFETPAFPGRDAIEWFSKAHDVAVIRCPLPYDDVPAAREVLATQRPTSTDCQAAGYLAGLLNQHQHQRRKSANGTLGVGSAQEITTDINDLDVKLDDTELWQGFSGAPVFSPASSAGRLVAVVRTVNTGESESLVASFIAPALDARGDADCDGPGRGLLRDLPGFMQPRLDDHQCWRRLRPAVVTLLKQNTDVGDMLRTRCPSQPQDARIDTAEGLADTLYQLPRQQVIDSLLYTLGRMSEPINTDGLRTLEGLARTWLVLLAAEGSGSLRGIHDFRADADAIPLVLQAAQPLLIDVEAQAAEAEGRDAQFLLNGSHLRSPLDLTPEHNTGLDENGAQVLADTKDACRLKAQPGMEAFSDSDAKNQLERFATRPETGLAAPLSPTDDAERGAIISDQLDLASSEAGASFYLRIPPPGHGNDTLRQLHRWCLSLLLIEVQPRDDRARMKALSGLNRIIHRVQQLLADNSRDPSP